MKSLREFQAANSNATISIGKLAKVYGGVAVPNGINTAGSPSGGVCTPQGCMTWLSDSKNTDTNVVTYNNVTYIELPC